MNRNLLIIGAGEYGCVAYEVAESMNYFEKIEFLDDKNKKAIGTLDIYERLSEEYSYAFVAVGNSEFRLNWISKLEKAGFVVATLVSPDAFVSPTSKIMKGSIIEPKAVVQANAMVSVGCLICSGAVLKHNCFVSEGCYIDCNSIVSSGKKVPEKFKINEGQAF